MQSRKERRQYTKVVRRRDIRRVKEGTPPTVESQRTVRGMAQTCLSVIKRRLGRKSHLPINQPSFLKERKAKIYRNNGTPNSFSVKGKEKPARTSLRKRSERQQRRRGED